VLRGEDGAKVIHKFRTIIILHGTDTRNHSGAQLCMETMPSPRVVISDRVDGGVYIEFTDGKGGLYSSSLLFEMLPKAEQIIPAGPDE